LPGYEDIDDSAEEEDEDPIVLESRLKAITEVLGERWVEPPIVEFSAAPPPKAGEDQPRAHVLKRSNGGAALHAQYRIEHIVAPVVRDTFIANGLTRTEGQDFCVQWSGPGMKDPGYANLHEHQRVNHFPGSTELTRKDSMFLHLNEMAEVFGRESFDFIPETYVLPEQVEKFLEAYEAKKGLWIVKPSNNSCGRGIFVLRELDELPLHEKSVVSKYVENPLLIQGLKFDLRIYVLVTQYDPLRAYVYREGLARFASAPFSTAEEHLSDSFRHLTNYSVNKTSSEFRENKSLQADNCGHKWSLSALNRHLAWTGTDVNLMWSRIMDLIAKTLLAVEPTIGASTRHATDQLGTCFEIYGFDILVDTNLKPWILEVNLSPSMQADSPLDWQVKSTLVSDAFNLIGVCQPDLRTIATCRARSKLLQAKLSQRILVKERGRSFTGLHMDKQQRPGRPRYLAARANRSGAAHAVPSSPLVLDGLSEIHLKMLARSLQEIRRARHGNFIRLFPTRSSIDRYARITDARSPLIRMGGKDSRLGMKLSASQLLAAMLYGCTPLRCRPNLLAQVPASLWSGHAATHHGVIRKASRKGSDPFAQLEDGRLELDEDPGVEGDAASDASGSCLMGPHLSIEEREAERVHAVRAICALSTKDSCRLVLMEYLVRIMRVCADLSFSEKAALAQSAAFQRLSLFRRQVTVMKSTWGPKGPPPAEDATRRVSPTSASETQPQQPQPAQPSTMELEAGSLVEGILATCQGSLSGLAEESWAGVSSLGSRSGHAATTAATDRPKSAEAVRLSDYLPKEFALSPLGRRALQALPLLTASDLESFLQSPDSVAEFGMLRELFATGQQHSHSSNGHGRKRHSKMEVDRDHTPACLLYSPLLELLQGRAEGADEVDRAVRSRPTTPASNTGQRWRPPSPAGTVSSVRSRSASKTRSSSKKTDLIRDTTSGALRDKLAAFESGLGVEVENLLETPTEAATTTHQAVAVDPMSTLKAVPPKMPARFVQEQLQFYPPSATAKRGVSAVKANCVSSRASDIWLNRGLKNVRGGREPPQPSAGCRSMPLLPELQREESHKARRGLTGTSDMTASFSLTSSGPFRQSGSAFQGAPAATKRPQSAVRLKASRVATSTSRLLEDIGDTKIQDAAAEESADLLPEVESSFSGIAATLGDGNIEL